MGPSAVCEDAQESRGDATLWFVETPFSNLEIGDAQVSGLFPKIPHLDLLW